MTTTDLAIKPKAEIEFGTISPGALMPRNFEGLYRISEIMSASGLMPKGIDTPAAVFVAVQMGLEVGLSPMQAVQNIAVINGRPSMWGDAVLALIRSSGVLEDFDEYLENDNGSTVAVCTAKRKGQSKPITRRFSMADAKQAGLTGKTGPWSQYPKRMLQMRARSWALRDGFGDVLKGLRVAEEVMDYDIDMGVTSNGTYAAPAPASDIDEMISDPEQPASDDAFANLSKEIAGPDLDAFIDSIAKKGKHTVDEIKTDAVKRWDSFVKAFKKFQRQAIKPEPVQDIKTEPAPPEPEQSPEVSGSTLPISATPEYKRLMDMKHEFREYYLGAKKDTGVEPDSVENCLFLIAAINQMIDMDNDR